MLGIFLNPSWVLRPTPIGNYIKQTTHNKIGKKVYYEARTTPGLWRQKNWRPIQFCLIVDDFGVEYVGENMQITWPPSFKNITISQKIGREIRWY